MSTTLHRRRTRGARLMAAVGALALGVTMTACSSDTESNEDASTPTTDSSESSGEWPRTVETADGPVTLDARPERIVSTSVTLTGTLLALDAPLYGTAAQPPSTVTDDDGLFIQWADVAAERDVEILYQGEPSLEAITAATPDLIVVSSSGADSTLDQVELLSQIAPTLVYDYSDKSWQDLTTQVAEAVGAEERAAELLEEFDSKVDEAKSTIAPALAEDNTVSILTYNSPEDSRIFTDESAQGRLATRLGFEIASVPETAGAAAAGRSDIIAVATENLPLALTGGTTFIINALPEDADRLKADPTLANTKSVQNDAVHALGYDSFRLDYYSANNVVDRIVDALG
ncbi:Fe2+-enterobactin ABC transporter substrate-binding protein [Rhodococcus artemisiae]|uniref:Fe2+-enterobactin ABC transporter substrate-binding protein n=1 Tax=Rhodococcus artemisiae TaxID=714159 RepID=A0ABU7L7Y1_9NOCA|nr:Fe2+-enterobactin ABC transporter substrate-binding protein [Rhodococcus artemisiae]MEE2057638.1 Fe2+-enterobactin ABC transporter substrate-binding protein [Rhodococcus artemisiae]